MALIPYMIPTYSALMPSVEITLGDADHQEVTLVDDMIILQLFWHVCDLFSALALSRT